MDTIQSLLPLADCSVNDALVTVVPFLKQSFFQMLNITILAVVHLLSQNAPNCSRQLMEAIDQFFLGNAAIIF